MKKKLFKLLQIRVLWIKKISYFCTKAKNKICGDEIDIEIEKDFKNIRFETNSCIYTQASAAILADNFSKIYNYGLKNMLNYIKKNLMEKI